MMPTKTSMTNGELNEAGNKKFHYNQSEIVHKTDKESKLDRETKKTNF